MSSSLLNDSTTIPAALPSSIPPSATMPPHPSGNIPVRRETPGMVRVAAAPAATWPAPGLGESILWTLGFFAVTQIAPACVLVMWLVTLGGSPEIPNELFLPVLLGGMVLGVCFSVFALWARVGPNWRKAINLRRPALVPTLLAMLCLPGLITIGITIQALVQELLHLENPVGQMIADGVTQYSLWFCVLVIAVGAAVNEELFCRGFLGHGLVGRYGVLIGVVITSVLFGLLHANIPQGTWTFILGFAMHLAYVATRSLWVPILMHFLNNLAAVVFVSAFANYEPTGWQFLGFAVAANAVAILSGLALYRLRDRRVALALAA